MHDYWTPCGFDSKFGKSSTGNKGNGQYETLKFEAAKQIIVDHDDVERKNLLKLGDKPDISNSVLEYILNGAIGESSTRRECMHGEAITHLRKAYTTVKEQGHETYGGLSGAIMQPVQVMWQDTFMRHLMTM